MGNQGSNQNKKPNVVTSDSRVVLKLRYRDIILHYPFKFKVSIGDIDIFPGGFDGLRLWDTDVILSRFIILENERFEGRQVCVFKAGVGLAGISLSKWTTSKNITMIDFKPEVVKNMNKNCDINQVKNVQNVLIDLNEFDSYNKQYDIVLSTNLFGQGFNSTNVLNLWRKLLKINGQAFLIIPDRKDQMKKFIQSVDKTQFKINNLVLTAEEYEASPIFNKIQGETQFPLIGKSTFYVIGLIKLREGEIMKVQQESGNQQNHNIQKDTKKQIQKPQVKQKEDQKQRENELEKKEQVKSKQNIEEQRAPENRKQSEQQKEKVNESKKIKQEEKEIQRAQKMEQTQIVRKQQTQIEHKQQISKPKEPQKDEQVVQTQITSKQQKKQKLVQEQSKVLEQKDEERKSSEHIQSEKENEEEKIDLPLSHQSENKQQIAEQEQEKKKEPEQGQEKEKEPVKEQNTKKNTEDVEEEKEVDDKGAEQEINKDVEQSNEQKSQ